VRTGRDADGAIRDASGRMISGTAGLAPRDSHPASRIAVEFIPLAYDHERLAGEMRDEKLPDEFIETILTGWWTSCLEVLPAKERRRGRF
jgi:hypothetical protein